MWLQICQLIFLPFCGLSFQFLDPVVFDNSSHPRVLRIQKADVFPSSFCLRFLVERETTVYTHVCAHVCEDRGQLPVSSSKCRTPL